MADAIAALLGGGNPDEIDPIHAEILDTVIGIDAAIQCKLTVQWESINAAEFAVLRMLNDERVKFQERQQRSEQMAQQMATARSQQKGF